VITVIQHSRGFEALITAPSANDHFASRRPGPDRIDDIESRGDLVVIDHGDDITGTQPCPVRRCTTKNIGDQHTLHILETEGFCQCCSHVLPPETEPAT